MLECVLLGVFITCCCIRKQQSRYDEGDKLPRPPLLSDCCAAAAFAAAAVATAAAAAEGCIPIYLLTHRLIYPYSQGLSDWPGVGTGVTGTGVGVGVDPGAPAGHKQGFKYPMVT